MAAKSVPQNRSQWYVECGKTEDGKGPRFYLGHTHEVTEDQARIRRERVRKFWEGRECWDERSLEWAKQIGKGATQLIFQPLTMTDGARNPGLYQLTKVQLDALNERHNGNVSFVIPADHQEDYSEATGWAYVRVKKHGGTIDPNDDGTMLYGLLDKYAEYASKTLVTADDSGDTMPSEWSGVYAKQILKIKDATPDKLMSQLDYASIEQIVLYFAHRPKTLKGERAMAVKSASAYLKAFKRFLRWAPKHSRWRKPEDWDEAFVHKPRKSNLEKSERPIGLVDSYSVPQLETIYRYATPYERNLFLCALNCGFGAIEISSLRKREVIVEHGQAWIKRVRLKPADGVYGEHWLWPETMLGLQWAMQQLEAIKGPIGEADFIVGNGAGERLVKRVKSGRSNKAASAWETLINRIQKDYPDFPALSFGKLRKTAGDLIKAASDGETMGVFHQRSSAVASDDESEVYANRNYAKVAKAQRAVYERLSGMFALVDDPFATHQKNYLGMRVVDQMRQLWAEGVKPSEIAAKLGVSRQTVYRYKPSVEAPAEVQA